MNHAPPDRENCPFNVDLHIHTTASDGTYTPTEVVELATRKRIRALAITDHDSVQGVAEALVAGAQLGVEVVPAVEFSTCPEPDKDFIELHLLGYFIDPENLKMNEVLNLSIEGRMEQKKLTIKKLQEFGFDVPEEEVFSLTNGVPGNPHIAEVVLHRNPGRFASEQQLYDEYLSVGGKINAPRPFELSLEEAIQVVLDAGGVPVLPHPGAYPKVKDPVGVVRRAIPLGLCGIEANYTYDKNWSHYGISRTELQAIIRRFDALADELGLLKTGGSDFHGDRKPIELGEMGMVYEDYVYFKEACGG